MKKNILVVDDSASVRQIVSMTLNANGYNTILAEDGVDGLAKLKANSIDLIISDVNMPNKDGIAFISEVKTMPEHAYTPVLMLTTESQDDMKEKGKAIGVKAWLVKPFRPDVIISALKKLL